jgi:hypothetical protein
MYTGSGTGCRTPGTPHPRTAAGGPAPARPVAPAAGVHRAWAWWRRPWTWRHSWLRRSPRAGGRATASPRAALLAAPGAAFAAVVIGQMANAFACRSTRPPWSLGWRSNRLVAWTFAPASRGWAPPGPGAATSSVAPLESRFDLLPYLQSHLEREPRLCRFWPLLSVREGRPCRSLGGNRVPPNTALRAGLPVPAVLSAGRGRSCRRCQPSRPVGPVAGFVTDPGRFSQP